MGGGGSHWSWFSIYRAALVRFSWAIFLRLMSVNRGTLRVLRGSSAPGNPALDIREFTSQPPLSSVTRPPPVLRPRAFPMVTNLTESESLERREEHQTSPGKINFIMPRRKAQDKRVLIKENLNSETKTPFREHEKNKREINLEVYHKWI